MAILDDSSLKIDPYYKTTNGYTHMYLASNDVLMDDDKTTLQTKMNSVDDALADTITISTIGVPITCAAGKTYKTTTELPLVSGYVPICSMITGTGSNNIYNYYNEVRLKQNSTYNTKSYVVYTEWKNPSTTAVKSATASVAVIWAKSAKITYTSA